MAGRPKTRAKKTAARKTAVRPPAFTPLRRSRFLAHLEANPQASIREAAEHVGVKRWQVKQLLADDPDFDAAYRAARGTRRDKIRDEIWQRAFDRDDASSGRLLLKLAEAELPEFAPFQRLEHSGTDGRPIEIRLAFDATAAPELVEKLREK